MRGASAATFRSLLEQVVATQSELDALAQSVHETAQSATRAESRASALAIEAEMLRDAVAERDSTIEAFSAMVEDLEAWEGAKQEVDQALVGAQRGRDAAESKNAQLRAVVRHCKRKTTALCSVASEMALVLAELRERRGVSGAPASPPAESDGRRRVAPRRTATSDFVHAEALLQKDCELAALRQRLEASEAARERIVAEGAPAAARVSGSGAPADDDASPAPSVGDRLRMLESMLRSAETKISELTRNRSTGVKLLRVAERRATSAIAERDEVLLQLTTMRLEVAMRPPIALGGGGNV